MKVVSGFCSTPLDGFFLDLDDRPMALAVSPNDGDLTLLIESADESRLNQTTILGKDVIEFKIERVRGEECLLFQYYRGKEKKTHILGRLIDREQGESWIEFVNKIYEKKRKHRKDRAEGRAGQFFENPIIHDIIADQVNRVLPGDYLSSGDDYPTPTYEPFWQHQYVKRSMALLKETANLPKSLKIKEEWLQPPEHRYPYLVERIKYKGEDYGNRVTQPLEMIFDREPRSDKIGIIPLGEATHFAMVYYENSNFKTTLHLEPNKSTYDIFEDWLRAITNLPTSREKLILCSLTDTVVDYLLRDLVMKKNLPIDQKMEMPTIHSLCQWLSYYHHGIITCDVGIAFQVLKCMQKENFPGKAELSLVPYDRPVKVGQAYRVDDELWGYICWQALKDCLTSKHPKMQESLMDTRNRAKKLNIEWLQAA